MAATATDNGVTATGNGQLRLRTNVLDALMAAKGIRTKVAQAEAFDLERTYWFNIRSGRRTPTLATALRIAQVAGTTVEVLFEQVP
jgi:hypothetical protein